MLRSLCAWLRFFFFALLSGCGERERAGAWEKKKETKEDEEEREREVGTKRRGAGTNEEKPGDAAIGSDEAEGSGVLSDEKKRKRRRKRATRQEKKRGEERACLLSFFFFSRDVKSQMNKKEANVCGVCGERKRQGTIAKFFSRTFPERVRTKEIERRRQREMARGLDASFCLASGPLTDGFAMCFPVG